MVLRFRRSIRILPGIHINLSKGGASISVGGPGASINVGKRGVTRTVGIPGTGISDRTVISRPHQGHHDGDLVQAMPKRRGHPLITGLSIIIGLAIVAAVLGAVFGAHG
jgi:hypothetical protein